MLNKKGNARLCITIFLIVLLLAVASFFIVKWMGLFSSAVFTPVENDGANVQLKSQNTEYASYELNVNLNGDCTSGVWSSTKEVYHFSEKFVATMYDYEYEWQGKSAYADDVQVNKEFETTDISLGKLRAKTGVGSGSEKEITTARFENVIANCKIKTIEGYGTSATGGGAFDEFVCIVEGDAVAPEPASYCIVGDIKINSKIYKIGFNPPEEKQESGAQEESDSNEGSSENQEEEQASDTSQNQESNQETEQEDKTSDEGFFSELIKKIKDFFKNWEWF